MENKYFTENFHDPGKECKKSFELLRRVYDIIEMSHLNDGKLIPNYCGKFDFPRQLGEEIYNLLSSKDQIFRDTVIKRQKNFRKRFKNNKREIE